MIFQRRISYDKWQAIDALHQSHTLHLPHDYPVLNLYSYHYDIQTRRITRQTPVPWNQSIHELYFPNLPYCPTFDVKGYTSGAGGKLPGDIQRWIHFPIDVLVQRLAPHRSLRDIYECVKRGNYHKLVREIRGVDPVILDQWTTDQAVLSEAHLFHSFTLAMKATKRVWMPEEALAFMRGVQHKEAACRLVELGYIILRGDKSALAWAAKAHDTFTAEIQGLPVEFIHDSSKVPEKLKHVRLDPCKPVMRYDTQRAVDSFINYERVATTMLDVVEWTRTPPDDTVQGITVIEVRKFAQAIDRLKDMGADMERTLVISSTGTVRMEAPHHYTVRLTQPMPPYKRGDVVMLNLTQLQKYRVVAPSSPSPVLYEPGSVYVNTRRAASCTYEQSIYLEAGKYDHVVLLGGVHTLTAWKREAVRVAGGKGKCTFISVDSHHQ